MKHSMKSYYADALDNSKAAAWFEGPGATLGSWDQQDRWMNGIKDKIFCPLEEYLMLVGVAPGNVQIGHDEAGKPWVVHGRKGDRTDRPMACPLPEWVARFLIATEAKTALTPREVAVYVRAAQKNFQDDW